MSRTLTIGMTGQDVADLQAALNYHLRPPKPPHTLPGPDRPPLNTDGQFGNKTDARLREFQRLNGLDDDGVLGRDTRPLLTKAKQVTVKIPLAPQEGPPNVSAFSAASSANIRAFGFPQLAQAKPSALLVGQSKPLIAPVKLQNRQVQMGGSLTLDPSIGPTIASFLSVQWTWVEQRDGRHFELALGNQLATALTNETFGLATSPQSFAQVSVSDVLTIDSANLHLFSPSAQVSFQANVVDSVTKSMSVSISLQNQIAWDFVKQGNNPVFSLFCQQQLAWTYDLAKREGITAPSFLLGATWQTSFF